MSRLLGPDGNPIDGATALGERDTAKTALAGQTLDLRQHLARNARAEKLERWLDAERRRCGRRGWKLLVNVSPEGFFEGRFVAKCRLEPIAAALARRMSRMDPPQAAIEGKVEFDNGKADVDEALHEAIEVALSIAKEVE